MVLCTFKLLFNSEFFKEMLPSSTIVHVHAVLPTQTLVMIRQKVDFYAFRSLPSFNLKLMMEFNNFSNRTPCSKVGNTVHVAHTSNVNALCDVGGSREMFIFEVKLNWIILFALFNKRVLEMMLSANSSKTYINLSMSMTLELPGKED